MKNLATTITFCALIGSLSVASMVNPVRDFSETENRKLAQLPEFSFESLFEGKFTADYETFITDQFVARDFWITLKNRSELAIGKKDSGGVYFGKDGFLIEKIEVDEEQASYNFNALKNFVELTKDDHNVRVLVAPTASLILKDKLPTHAPVWDQGALLDALDKIDGFVDAREVLNAHTNEYIYYRTDHHWTTLGSYYAYTSLCESLGIEPIALDALNKETLSDEFIGTLAAKVNITTESDELFTYNSGVQVQVDYNMGQSTADSLIDESYLEKRDKYGAFLNGNQPVVDVQTSVKNGKTLLLVKDSYAHCMVPLLVNHYERILLVDHRNLTIGTMSFIDLIESKGGSIDDIVFLYNAENFTADRNLVWLSK